MRFLSNKEKKNLSEILPFGYEISKKDQIKEKENIIYKGDDPFLIKLDNKYFPHLKSVNESFYKSVFVDKGAIPFVIKGADLMRPGITKIDDNIEKNDTILIKDENHNKTIALGFALYDSSDMRKQEKGKSVKIYHFVGDDKY